MEHICKCAKQRLLGLLSQGATGGVCWDRALMSHRKADVRLQKVQQRERLVRKERPAEVWTLKKADGKCEQLQREGRHSPEGC